MIADDHQRALTHLSAALDAMTATGDTLAAAVIAQAMSVVERAIAARVAH